MTFRNTCLAIAASICLIACESPKVTYESIKVDAPFEMEPIRVPSSLSRTSALLTMERWRPTVLSVPVP